MCHCKVTVRFQTRLRICFTPELQSKHFHEQSPPHLDLADRGDTLERTAETDVAGSDGLMKGRGSLLLYDISRSVRH